VKFICGDEKRFFRRIGNGFGQRHVVRYGINERKYIFLYVKISGLVVER
jgi:hypothetical protein